MTASNSTSEADSTRIGRRLPAMVLVLLVLAMLLLNLIPSGYPVAPLRLALFDAYQHLMPRERKATPVVIVEINERELAVLGQWPWPRQYMAALVDAIAAAKPAAVGLDIIFAEPDRASPAALAEARPDLSAEVRSALNSAQSNDHILAKSLSQVPLVLGVAGFDQALADDAQNLRIWPMTVNRADRIAAVRDYPHVLASLPELQRAARGQGLLTSESEGGVVRRINVVGSARGQLMPSFALETLRVAQGATAIHVDTDPRGVTAASVGDIRIPLQANGEAWVHYTDAATQAGPGQGKGRSAPRVVSALRLLKGEVPASELQGKMVLVGLTALGLVDTITTPMGDRRAGVEVHAQWLEAVQDGRFLTRPPWLLWLEAATLLLAGAVLVLWVPRISMNAAVALVMALVLVQGTMGLLLFRGQGWLFDASATTVLSLLMFVMLMARAFEESLRHRRRAEQALQEQREASARIAGELEAARRIQLGSLPVAADAFPGEERFKVAALLEPAQEIGGDLYDFYMLDANRVLFLVGDVSGKGVPASLFMAVTKALSKSVALRADCQVAEMVVAANLELSRENREMLFVTLIAGVLDVQTGVLDVCNAGHDAPYLVRADGSVQQFQGEHGPPLCVLDDYSYPIERLQLAPGDRVCVITDGVNEAMNLAGEVFGTTRLVSALGAASAGPQALIDSTREAVRSFVGEAAPSDDLTLLAFQWNGP